MSVEVATYLDDLVTSNPTASDPVAQGDDHLRLLKTVLQATFPNADRAFRFLALSAKSSNFNANVDQTFYPVDATGGAVVASLPDVTTTFPGFTVRIQKVDASANTVTAEGNGSDAVNGGLNWVLSKQWESVTLVSTGVLWLVPAFPTFASLIATPTTLAGYGITDAEPLGKLRGILNKTDSYTLALGDEGYLIRMGKGTAQTLTVPANASVAFAVNTKIDVTQSGDGELTIAASGGVTINSQDEQLKLAGKWAGATLVKVDTNEWDLFGNLKA